MTMSVSQKCEEITNTQYTRIWASARRAIPVLAENAFGVVLYLGLYAFRRPMSRY